MIILNKTMHRTSSLNHQFKVRCDNTIKKYKTLLTFHKNNCVYAFYLIIIINMFNYYYQTFNLKKV